MIRFILFDLGQTLVHYFNRKEFKAMLPGILDSLMAALGDRLTRSAAECRSAMLEQGRTNEDFSVRPLARRLAVVLNLPEGEVVRLGLLDLFMAPLLSSSSLYEDTRPALEELSRTHTLTLLSNIPWGCPPSYFEDDLRRYELFRFFTRIIFCTDVGFRKPHPAVFHYALRLLGARPEEAVMIGDRPDWDVEGARRCGLHAILIDREGEQKDGPGVIRNLCELPAALAELR
ncbi:MAG: HAD family hydrolase [Spirochaetales bacterium]|nr:HAD family hydrolase [Spirochaetales bacterium]